jgi:hypothetical protein
MDLNESAGFANSPPDEIDDDRLILGQSTEP